MTVETANTIMLTTKCSGGCSHCPFSNPDLEKLFLAPNIIETIINQSPGRLAILSGGEPFEHPMISDILTNLGKQTLPFRIATGGFIDLNPWIATLKHLSRIKGGLQGISLGTDVLSTRVTHSNWVPIWKNNIQLFFEFQIPYSLTFSIENDFDVTRLNLWDWADQFNGKPDFIYIRYSNDILLQKWMGPVIDSFKGIPIIYDNIFLDS